MNITGLLLPLALAPSIMKFLKRTESETTIVTEAKPPTSKTGVRPTCPIGQKVIYDTGQDRYRCIVDYK